MAQIESIVGVLVITHEIESMSIDANSWRSFPQTRKKVEFDNSSLMQLETLN